MEAEYPHGLDFAWFAFDHYGHVGCFVTGGCGPVPDRMLSRVQMPACAEFMFMTLPVVSSAELVVVLPRPDDYRNMAERGIFAFDWRDVERPAVDCSGHYELIARPTHPLSIDLLPLEFRVLLACSEPVAINFSTSERVDIAGLLACLSPADG